MSMSSRALSDENKDGHYLRRPVVIIILRRQTQRTGDRSIEEWRLSVTSIGDDVL